MTREEYEGLKDALERRIEELEDQCWKLDSQYYSQPEVIAERRAEWDAMPEHQKKIYEFFSRQFIEHHSIQDYYGVAKTATATAQLPSTIRFFKELRQSEPPSSDKPDQ